MSRKLHSSEIQKLNQLMNAKWKQVYKYGDPKADQKDLCIRLRNTKSSKYQSKVKNRIITTDDQPIYLFPYSINFMLTNEKTINPDPNLTLSHVCGKPKKGKKNMCAYKCMNGSHIVEESQYENNKRKKCHTRINKYYRKHYSQTGYIGQLFVKDTIDINLISVYDEKGKKRNNKDRQQAAINEAKGACTHDPPCFINWHKIQ